MKITPELLAALGYTRDKIGSWHHCDLDFDGTVTEYDDPSGVRLHGFGTKFISTADELLNVIFAAGVEEGQRRSAADFRRLIGLRGEG